MADFQLREQLMDLEKSALGPRLAGLLGWPVGHSLSPLIHGYWFQSLGIDGAYIRLPVRPENLETVLRTLPLMGFQGVNVTIPHKEAMFRLVDSCDPMAKTMQAVNTVLIMPNLKLHGLNTDGLGFYQALKETIPDFDPAGGPSVLLGAGGAARAIATVLVKEGARCLRLVNRTLPRAEDLGRSLQRWSKVEIETVNWADRSQALKGAGLLVNCTSLGMKGQPALDLSLNALPSQSPVFDIVYNPRMTGLLTMAQTSGHPIIDGLGMLLHQAVPGFSHWGGLKPSVDQTLRDRVLQALHG